MIDRRIDRHDAYYWATHNGPEINLVLFEHGCRIGVECKRSDAPNLTPSMRVALTDLKLDELLVVYPGTQRLTFDATRPPSHHGWHGLHGQSRQPRPMRGLKSSGYHRFHPWSWRMVPWAFCRPEVSSIK